MQTLGEVPAELALTAESDQALLEQAERVDHATVVRLLDLLGEAMEAVRAGADARTRLELALVKAARPEVDGSTAGAARPDRAARARRSRPRRPPAEAALAGGGPARGAADGTLPAAENPEAVPPPARAPGRAPLRRRTRRPCRRPPRLPAARPPAENPEAVPPPAAPAEPAPAPAGPGGRAVPAAPPADGDLDMVVSLWPAVVDLVRSENALLGALIADAAPERAERGRPDADVRIHRPVPEEEGRGPRQPGDRHRGAARDHRGARAALIRAARGSRAGAARASPAAEHSEEEWVRRLMDEFDAEEIHGGVGPASGAEPGRGDERGGQAVTSNEKGA